MTATSGFSVGDAVTHITTGQKGEVTGLRRIVNGKLWIRVRLVDGTVTSRPEEEWKGAE